MERETLKLTDSDLSLLWHAMGDKARGDRKAAATCREAGANDMATILEAQAAQGDKLAEFLEARYRGTLTVESL